MNAGRCMAFTCTVCDKLYLTRDDADKCCHCKECGEPLYLLYNHKCRVTWNDFCKAWKDIGRAFVKECIVSHECDIADLYGVLDGTRKR